MWKIWEIRKVFDVQLEILSNSILIFITRTIELDCQIHISLPSCISTRSIKEHYVDKPSKVIAMAMLQNIVC